jgi:hypothetical protein
VGFSAVYEAEAGGDHQTGLRIASGGPNWARRSRAEGCFALRHPRFVHPSAADADL